MYEHGGDIYRREVRLDFSANLNFLGMPESVRRAAREGAAHADCYPDIRCEALNRAIAAREQVHEKQVLCGNGATDLIFTLALAERPRRAVVFAPTFHEYTQALEAVGCEIIFCPLRAEEKFRYDRRVLSILTEDVDMLVLCNPNNPTGQTAERALLQEILETCQAQGICLLLDECFIDFLEDPAAHTLVPQLAQYPCLFILKAFTKLYAMAGLRLGYALTADAGRMERLLAAHPPWSVSIPAQQAGLAALGETDYVCRYRALLAEERPWLKIALTDAGMRVFGSQANYVFFEGERGLAAALAEEGILIRDCSNYRGLTEGYYRVAVRSHAENVQLMEAISRIAEKERRA